MAGKQPKYRVLVGINYPPDNTRSEPGDTITGATLPEGTDYDALVKAGVLEETK